MHELRKHEELEVSHIVPSVLFLESFVQLHPKSLINNKITQQVTFVTANKSTYPFLFGN